MNFIGAFFIGGILFFIGWILLEYLRYIRVNKVITCIGQHNNYRILNNDSKNFIQYPDLDFLFSLSALFFKWRVKDFITTEDWNKYKEFLDK